MEDHEDTSERAHSPFSGVSSKAIYGHRSNESLISTTAFMDSQQPSSRENEFESDVEAPRDMRRVVKHVSFLSKILGTAVAFIVIVSFWGLVDTLVEMASGGILWKQAVIYCTVTACSALGLTLYNKVSSTPFAVEDTFNMF